MKLSGNEDLRVQKNYNDYSQNFHQNVIGDELRQNQGQNAL